MKSYLIATSITLLLISSCAKTIIIEEPTHFEVSETDLKDIGNENAKFIFEITKIDSSTQRCTFTAPVVTKNDTIKTIEAFVKEKDLFINIITSPFDWDCLNGDCYSWHEISFNMKDMKKGTFKVQINVNNSNRPGTLQCTIE